MRTIGFTKKRKKKRFFNVDYCGCGFKLRGSPTYPARIALLPLKRKKGKVSTYSFVESKKIQEAIKCVTFQCAIC